MVETKEKNPNGPVPGYNLSAYAIFATAALADLLAAVYVPACSYTQVYTQPIPRPGSNATNLRTGVSMTMSLGYARLLDTLVSDIIAAGTS